MTIEVARELGNVVGFVVVVWATVYVMTRKS